jgi:hypothetical protein
MKRCVIVSHRYNPGHLSVLIANFKLLSDVGYYCYLRVHLKTLDLIKGEINKNRVSLFECLGLKNRDLFIVWFPSISALLDIIFVRILSRATTVYVYHEPYVSYTSYRVAGFGVIKTLKISSISIISRIICACAHKIILPSKTAFNALPSAKINPSRYRKINLMFSDESNDFTSLNTRNAISYIGTIAADHAFDKYLQFAHETIQSNALESYIFVIATRSELSSTQREKVEYCVLNGRMQVKSGVPLSNEEINYYYASSFVVWNAYRRSMQSGVLPKAYMFGTPVIISEANQSEYFQNHHHGVMISSEYRFDELYSAVEEIASKWSEYSNNCRSCFLETFYYKSLAKQFIDFVSGGVLSAS